MTKVESSLAEARQYLSIMSRLLGPQFKQHGVWNHFEFMRRYAKAYDVVAAETMMTPKACYDNSRAQAVIFHSDVVDGLVNVHGLQLRHSWVVEDGQAMDYTIPDPEKHKFVGVLFPAEVAIRVGKSKEWEDSEGIIGALQKMSVNKRTKYLKAAGYE